jgi:hypothetical protein
MPFSRNPSICLLHRVFTQNYPAACERYFGEYYDGLCYTHRRRFKALCITFVTAAVWNDRWESVANAGLLCLYLPLRQLAHVIFIVVVKRQRNWNT